MRSTAKCYETLREYIETVPLIDCHDHTAACIPRYTDPFEALINGYYFRQDLINSSSHQNMRIVDDRSLPYEQRWKAFEYAWNRCRHTGYAEVTRRVLRRFYDEQEPSLAGCHRMRERLLDLSDEKVHEEILEEAGIQARLVNVVPDVKAVMDGTFKLTPRAKLVIRLPEAHGIRNYEMVDAIVSPLGRKVTSLGEYLDACREIFTAHKRFGAVAFKDQCAYTRTLEFGNPTRAEAEEVFNWFMCDPHRHADNLKAAKPLDDYLFHEFMRMARDLDLPVQLHTGALVTLYQPLAHTNAMHLAPVLALHRETQFDIFHANWPYSGELLHLGKSFPNVRLDFCWTNILDPIYCHQLFKQAISVVPHFKIHAYGADFKGFADRAWAHASMARDNVAIALADLVEMEYLGLDDAKEIASLWLFGNANEFFRLGIKPAARGEAGANEGDRRRAGRAIDSAAAGSMQRPA